MKSRRFLILLLCQSCMAMSLAVADLPSSTIPAATPTFTPPGDLSDTSIAVRIAKDEGYLLTRFKPTTGEQFQVVVRSGGSEEVLDVPPGKKEYVIAVGLGQHNTALYAVRVYFDAGSVSKIFPPGRYPDNLSLKSELEDVTNGLFLALHGTGGDVQISVRPRK